MEKEFIKELRKFLKDIGIIDDNFRGKAISKKIDKLAGKDLI